MSDTHASFTGSIPQYYDNCLGPAWFDAFGDDLAQRLPREPTGDVLEIACGTGLVTRWVRENLDKRVRLIATDLSAAMLNYGRQKLSDYHGIEWREADATSLPFDNDQFGAVVCAFGVMFVPDKRKVFNEIHRVLKEDGLFLFNVWDRIELNPCSAANAEVIEALFPGDEELRFGTPYEMHDPEMLRSLLSETGFREERIETKRVEVHNVSARSVANGQIRGTPRSLLLQKHGVSLDDIVDKVTDGLIKIGGADPLCTWAQAVVVEARATG